MRGIWPNYFIRLKFNTDWTAELFTQYYENNGIQKQKTFVHLLRSISEHEMLGDIMPKWYINVLTQYGLTTSPVHRPHSQCNSGEYDASFYHNLPF